MEKIQKENKYKKISNKITQMKKTKIFKKGEVMTIKEIKTDKGKREMAKMKKLSKRRNRILNQRKRKDEI